MIISILFLVVIVILEFRLCTSHFTHEKKSLSFYIINYIKIVNITAK